MEIMIQTKQNRQVIDITPQINKIISGDDSHKLCHLSIEHTTAAITTADLDPGTDQDYLTFFEKVTPSADWVHPHDPSHTPDHIWSTIIGTQLTLPVREGKVVLGTWQRVVLIELSGPRKRKILVTMV